MKISIDKLYILGAEPPTENLKVAKLVRPEGFEPPANGLEILSATIRGQKG